MSEEMFGPYRIEALLGRGGMGEVHRAYDTSQDRIVALKRLTVQFANDADFQERFRRESQIVARLREPHVIPIHRYGEIDGRLYLDMRLVEGTDLSAILEKDISLSPARAVNITAQVASALDAAHVDGLIHRDVKPSNVLVTSTDSLGDQGDFVYLVDFGIARSVSATSGPALTMTGAAIGTIDYMAPERFLGGEVDRRADVYSLACMLFESLTGRKPYIADGLPGLMHAHLNTPPPLASHTRAGIPSGLDSVIAKGMAKDPNLRYSTAGELAAAARGVLTGSMPTAVASEAFPALPTSRLGQNPPPPSYSAPNPMGTPSGGFPAQSAPQPMYGAPGGPGGPPPTQVGMPYMGQPVMPQQYPSGVMPIPPHYGPPPKSGSKAGWIVAAVGVVAAVAATAVILVVNNKDSDTDPTAGPGTSETSTRTTTRTTRPTTTTTRTTSSGGTGAEAQLLSSLPVAYRDKASLCKPDPSRSASGLTAALECGLLTDLWTPDSGAFASYDSVDAQLDDFKNTLASKGVTQLIEGTLGCEKGNPTSYAPYKTDGVSHEGNYLSCFMDGGKAIMMWTDTERKITGTIRRHRDTDTGHAYTWWKEKSVFK